MFDQAEALAQAQLRLEERQRDLALAAREQAQLQALQAAPAGEGALTRIAKPLGRLARTAARSAAAFLI